MKKFWFFAWSFEPDWNRKSFAKTTQRITLLSYNRCPRKCARTNCEDYTQRITLLSAHIVCNDRRRSLNKEEKNTRWPQGIGHAHSAWVNWLLLLEKHPQTQINCLYLSRPSNKSWKLRLLNLPHRKPLMMKFNKPTSIGSEYMKPWHESKELNLLLQHQGLPHIRPLEVLNEGESSTAQTNTSTL